MELIYIHIIRGTITNFFVLFHLFTLAEAKYRKHIMYGAFATIYIAITIVSIIMYKTVDMTMFTKLTAITLIIMGLVCKPFFQVSFMKWLFNIITVINVFIFVVIISYTLAYDPVTHLLLRAILYSVIIFIFKKYLSPIYRQVVARWQLFLALAIAVFANFMFAIVKTNDIEVMLTEDLASLMIMVFTMLLIYTTIFISCRNLIIEKELASENVKVKMQHELLASELSSYEDFVSLAKQTRHDLRHHNSILTEYLSSSDVAGALSYLQMYDKSICESVLVQHCKNPIANTVLSLYERKAAALGVTIVINAIIPENLSLSPLEIGTMLSNILENAMEACHNSQSPALFISLTADADDDNLKIELRNNVSGKVKFENNLPVSTKENGGTGIKSVQRIVEKLHGMLLFRQDKDVFITQIILPI